METNLYNELNFWFRCMGDNTVEVYNGSEYIGTIHHVSGTDSITAGDCKIPGQYDEREVIANYRRFVERPEAALNNLTIPADPTQLTVQTAISIYKELLTGCLLTRAFRATKKNPDMYLSTITKCIDWLDSTDFFKCPASTIYHDAYPSGLLCHTLKVVRHTLNLRMLPEFQQVNIEDSVLVALVHDWCKIDTYESYTKNVKNDKTGVWEQVMAYRRHPSTFSFGHGESSLFLVNQFFKLSLPEALAVRWHMGEYNVAPNEMNDLHHANELYPIVQLIQFADRLSVTKYV